ncbi:MULTISPECIES: tyrosine-type recombinase/integrase [unclassified Streptomyces]|uniref:tyrosine-type recombinase/integrase n=1 Tax=unclassified Streptomyces TaxID=2593676 RepID=UPI0029B67A45|nr:MULTISPECIES: tyrosine-type recombinase/integrase [unclassified Streptomyces]MDX3771322.1 tyrosine-type recombinase/integrase [Streptomyces sp. AK08-01B]MDX3816678.1 tyrosine-type recombinase/integrase [Streptomyces sp. AK08-01A]
MSKVGEGEVIKKVRALEKQRDEGKVRKPGRPWTVRAWLLRWVEEIAKPSVRENTYAGYEVAVRVHLVPGVGAHRLDKLEPEHLERFYSRMLASGIKPSTAHQTHRTIRTALNHAMRRGHVTRNVASLAVPPRIEDEEVEPYDIEEVQRLLSEAAKLRNSARWSIALALGLRQGEALGLRWADLDTSSGVLRVRKNRLRPKYLHGGGCGTKPGYCKKRVRKNEDTANTKSRAGRRVIGVPDELVTLLELHRREQARERAIAGKDWRESGFVFTSPVGEPLVPSTDYDVWERLLADAKVRDGRLHDARHTAATVLLILGVPERVVMQIMGWSSTAMAARYQHVTGGILADVAQRVGGLIWEVAKDPEESGPEGSEKSR